jgi:hypothetical protein
LVCTLHHTEARYGVVKVALMLKIQRAADGQRVVFTLSGRIESKHVAELQRLFAAETDGVSLVLDLHEVKLVDREAVRFLARCESDGITLVHCLGYIRVWIEQEKVQP